MGHPIECEDPDQRDTDAHCPRPVWMTGNRRATEASRRCIRVGEVMTRARVIRSTAKDETLTETSARRVAIGQTEAGPGTEPRRDLR
jgi:hypothetical protein